MRVAARRSRWRWSTGFVDVLKISSLEGGLRFYFESGKGFLALVEVGKDGDPEKFLDLKIAFLGTR